MTEDKTTPKTGIKSLIKGLNTFYLIREYKQTLQASTLINNQWKTIGLQDIPLSNALSRIVLLIPNDETIFRQQQFSTDLVTEKDLKEAISLNIENWSPYPPNSPQFSITKKTKGQWVVATWLWKQSTQDRLINALPASIRHTHVLPEITWDCARVTGNEPTLLVSQTAQHLVYTFLDENNIPQYIAQPKNTAEAARFWRGLGIHANKIKNITLSQQHIANMPASSPVVALPGLPTHFKQVILKKQTARSHWLKKAQCKGTHDWINPSNWLSPALLILSLLCIWAITDALLITHKNQTITQLMSQSKQNYQKVINQQEKIENSLTVLTHYAQLKQKQQQVERILAELSTRIPNNIWLESIQLEQNWLDIRGRGKDVIRLLALLETLENARDIVLLNDVRTDARTGDEQFQIRLILKVATE